MKNSKSLGQATLFMYPQKGKYVGVWLELDLVGEGKNRDQLFERMMERIQTYIAFMQKKNLSDEFLNRSAPKRYWNKFYKSVDSLREEQAKRHVVSGRRAQSPHKSGSEFTVYRENLERVMA